MIKFNKEKILQPNTVVWCDTEDKANELLKWSHSEGLKWYGGNSFISENYWRFDKEKTCYCIIGGSRGSVENFKDIGYTILKYEDIAMPDKIKLFLPKEKNTDVYSQKSGKQYEIKKINWRELFDNTIEDIKPLLKVSNIELEEKPIKYVIDIGVEYTEEQVKELEKLGLKFKRKDV